MGVLCALFVLLAVSAFAVAQAPFPCETPKQWQGRMSTETHKEGREEEHTRIAYDEINNRARLHEDINLQTGEIRRDHLFIYNERKQYTYNYETKTCNVQALTQPFRIFEVPREAEFVNARTYGLSGAPGENMIVYHFVGGMKDQDFHGAVTYPSCVPVHMTTKGKDQSRIHREFYDITLGISDPGVFIPRPECFQQEEHTKRNKSARIHGNQSHRQSTNHRSELVKLLRKQYLSTPRQGWAG